MIPCGAFATTQFTVQRVPMWCLNDGSQQGDDLTVVENEVRYTCGAAQPLLELGESLRGLINGLTPRLFSAPCSLVAVTNATERGIRSEVEWRRSSHIRWES